MQPTATFEEYHVWDTSTPARVDNVGSRRRVLYYGGMSTTTKKKPDYRKQLYESVRISKRAYAKLQERAAEEHRTIIATLDNLLGV